MLRYLNPDAWPDLWTMGMICVIQLLLNGLSFVGCWELGVSYELRARVDTLPCHAFKFLMIYSSSLLENQARYWIDGVQKENEEAVLGTSKCRQVILYGVSQDAEARTVGVCPTSSPSCQRQSIQWFSLFRSWSYGWAFERNRVSSFSSAYFRVHGLTSRTSGFTAAWRDWTRHRPHGLACSRKSGNIRLLLQGMLGQSALWCGTLRLDKHLSTPEQ